MASENDDGAPQLSKANINPRASRTGEGPDMDIIGEYLEEIADEIIGVDLSARIKAYCEERDQLEAEICPYCLDEAERIALMMKYKLVGALSDKKSK